MEQFNRAERQPQNAEQRRMIKENALRAVHDIEQYEEMLKLERENEMISEKIKKKKSHLAFADEKMAQLTKEKEALVKMVEQKNFQLEKQQKHTEQTQKELQQVLVADEKIKQENSELKAMVEFRNASLALKDEIHNKESEELIELKKKVIGLEKNSEEKTGEIMGLEEKVVGLEEKVVGLEEANFELVNIHEEQKVKIDLFEEQINTLLAEREAMGSNPDAIICQQKAKMKPPTLEEELAEYERKKSEAKRGQNEGQSESDSNAKVSSPKESKQGVQNTGSPMYAATSTEQTLVTVTPQTPTITASTTMARTETALKTTALTATTTMAPSLTAQTMTPSLTAQTEMAPATAPTCCMCIRKKKNDENSSPPYGGRQ